MIERKLYIERLRSFIDQPEILKIIVGIRRCGKSVMLKLIQEELIKRGAKPENFIELNFEDMSLNDLRSAEKLHAYLNERVGKLKGRAYIFLDEIQGVDEWERCVNSIRAGADADIYLTGSNAELLSGEYATLIGGRYIHVRMLPFSFSEYLEAIRLKSPEISESESFLRYLRTGGMPFIAAIGLEGNDADAYLKDIYASVVMKDIILKNNIRNTDLLDRILLYVFANVGHPFSANSISKFFLSEKRKVSPETVLNYLKAAREAHLIYKVDRLDIPAKRQLKIDEKYFIADHGMREAIFGGNERDIERILENIICLEMLSRGYAVNVGRIAKQEIDFVCDKGKTRIYIQVAYLLASDETIEREFGVYAHVNDNHPKYVISMDEIDQSRDGIIHKNVRDFLLSR
jgi:predicted AAA+ superfamily ATPase